jgi:hypothetical protein
MILFDKYGIKITKSLISERPLEVLRNLVWNCRDLGLDTIHFVKRGESYLHTNSSSKAVEKEIKAEPNLSSETYYTWTGEFKKVKGVKRLELLKSYLPANKEQISNIMVNTAFQAYPYQVATLFSRVLSTDFKKLELLDIEIQNIPRACVGDPDILLIDTETKKLLFVEMKIFNSSHKYSYDQHLKYMTLNKVLSNSSEFSDYTFENIMLGGRDDLEKNFYNLNDSKLDIDNSNVKFIFKDNLTIQSEISSRMEKVTSEKVELSSDVVDLSFKFTSWNQLPEMIDDCELKENLVLFAKLIGEN